MSSIAYQLGSLAAQRLVLHKHASKPEMGDDLYSHITSSTHDSGRSMGRTNDAPQDNVNTSFMEHDRHLLRDPHAAATGILPVGSSQSKTALDRNTVIKKSPVKINAKASRPIGPHFDLRDKEIYIPDSLDDTNINILAHEIGHARVHEGAGGAVINSPYLRLPGLAAPILAAGLAYTPLKAPTQVGLTLAATAPMLLSEGLADYQGYKYLQEHGASKEDMRTYLKDIAAPQASYLALAGIGVGMGALARFAKNAAAHRLHGRRQFRGLDISIENRRGSYRHWYDPHTKRKGKTLQKHPYGYIRMSEGMDGDHVDCYIGPNEDAKSVYLIMSNKPPTFTKPDEQKCMLGFNSATAAKKAYLAHFDDPRFFRNMIVMPYATFEKKVLATRMRINKKIASNRYESDNDDSNVDSSMGPFADSTPGDYLGYPSGSSVGFKHIVGSPDSPSDRVDRMFRFNDQPQNTVTLDGDPGTQPLVTEV